jgi:hypothetical protein
MPSKSKKQQRFMGMVHAAQKGELENPSDEVKKAAKSMKKKDAKDFASTKHKGLPEKVKETFVSTTLEAFLNESFDEPNVEAFLDALMVSLMSDKGLTDQEADFVLGELHPDSIEVWAIDYEMSPGIIDPLADQIIEFVLHKNPNETFFEDEIGESYKGEDDDDPSDRVRDKVKVPTFRFNKERGYSEPINDEEDEIS